MTDVFSLKIGGFAGQGVKSSGLLFSKFAVDSGYNIYNYVEYPSLIKGGHNVIQVNISKDAVLGPSVKTDFLIALNQETVGLHLSELTSKAKILCDADTNIPKLPAGVTLFKVPLSKLAKDSGGGELLSNTVALGAAAALLGGTLKILSNLTNKEYEGQRFAENNLEAAALGFRYVLENYSSKRIDLLRYSKSDPKIVLNGNGAVALGAMSAKMEFSAIYPMSPISGILHILAKKQKEYGYIYMQPEDEISGINMAIGASFAGKRSMVATSGGGFCLMTEGLGLAGMTETPLVIVEGMRGAPATGLPTWSEQGDLQFVLHAHQGEFPRIVLAPGDLTEAFYLTMEAFNLADRYQTPVIILMDKNICDNDQGVPEFDISGYKIDRGKFTAEKVKDYMRYKLSEDGVSLRTVPGSGNFFISNSDEHDELGYSSEDAENRISQMKKRMAKLESCAKFDMPKPVLLGPEKADVTIVSWGSNKGSILQALKKFPDVNYLHIVRMNPFPSDAVKRILRGAHHIIDMECNYTGQLASLILEKTGIEIKDKFLKYDGRPIFVEEVEDKIESVLKGGK